MCQANKQVKDIIGQLDPDKVKCLFCNNFIPVVKVSEGKIHEIICPECIKKGHLDGVGAKMHVNGRGYFTN